MQVNIVILQKQGKDVFPGSDYIHLNMDKYCKFSLFLTDEGGLTKHTDKTPKRGESVSRTLNWIGPVPLWECPLRIFVAGDWRGLNASLVRLLVCGLRQLCKKALPWLLRWLSQLKNILPFCDSDREKR